MDINKIYEHDRIRLIQADCMAFMQSLPDKYYELAIVDPPYGIHEKILNGGRNGKVLFGAKYEEKQWDKDRPTKEYFNELIRVSKNQIICGGNYFADLLPPSRGWAVWLKQGGSLTVVNDELIYTSFDLAIKTFERCHGLDKGFMNKDGKNIHPTQKPVALYKWLLKNYAKEGDKIIKTQGRSMSIAIACNQMGFALN